MEGKLWQRNDRKNVYGRHEFTSIWRQLNDVRVRVIRPAPSMDDYDVPYILVIDPPESILGVTPSCL